SRVPWKMLWAAPPASRGRRSARSGSSRSAARRVPIDSSRRESGECTADALVGDPAVMEVAVALDILWPEGRIRRLAQVASEHGYDQIWISDHPLGRDPFLTVLDLARRVERIKLGIATVNASARHPAVLAASTATLSQCSSGRFWLGLGSS